MYNPKDPASRQALAAKLIEKLEIAGFVKQPQKVSGEEDIYGRAIPQLPGVMLLCYTSISMGSMRDLGEDAIRCLAVYVRKDYDVKKLFKHKTVNRVGEVDAIVERTLAALRTQFATVRDRDRKGLRCRCGAPCFTAKNGTEYCAETCWTHHA